jgi:hypothetical protein
VAPSISGVARPGNALTADPGQWSPSQSTFDYEWQSASDAAGTGAAAIIGAPNSSGYTVATADLARWVRVKVTPFGKDPNSAAYSAWVEVVSGKPTTPEISAMDAVGPKCGGGSGLAIVIAAPFAWLLRRRLR